MWFHVHVQVHAVLRLWIPGMCPVCESCLCCMYLPCAQSRKNLILMLMYISDGCDIATLRPTNSPPPVFATNLLITYRAKPLITWLPIRLPLSAAAVAPRWVGTATSLLSRDPIIWGTMGA